MLALWASVIIAVCVTDKEIAAVDDPVSVEIDGDRPDFRFTALAAQRDIQYLSDSKLSTTV